MTEAFVRNIDQFVDREGVDLVAFQKWQRKDDVTQKYLRRFTQCEGVLYVGKAQEKARVMRTERRRSRRTGGTYPWIVESTAMVNHYYFYCVDEDFGPFFLKFCSYFPYNAKLCINGHEYLKRQLAKRGVAFEALDNGVKSCADPKLMQRLCDGLSADKIDRLLRKWLRRLPHPFPARDRAAGYRYQLSILQAEFSLTQVLDQPVTGRVFFEEVIRENLDIGRPSQVSLVFDRKVNRRTPGRFRTRVITDGVVPSLHVDYKKTRIKQYHKEGQALRTETTINDTRDFAIGRRIENLPELRKIGFAANRRLLDVQRIGHDCFIGEASFQDMQRPVTVKDQRAAALRFADPRVQALLHVLLLFLLVQGTFTNKDVREHLAPLLGKKPSQLSPGQITYDLRRLRFHTTLEVVKNRPGEHRWKTSAEIEQLIRDLARLALDRTIAAILNRLGMTTAKGHTWTQQRVTVFRNDHQIAVYRDGERAERGEVNLQEAATRLGVSRMTVIRLIGDKVLPAKQTCIGAPYVIREADLDLSAVRRAIKDGRAVTHDPRQRTLEFQ